METENNTDASDNEATAPEQTTPTKEVAADTADTADTGCDSPCECAEKTKVTEADVLRAIVQVDSQTVTLAGKPHTVTAARLANGFTVVETSTAVDPNNFDPVIREAVNLKKITDKVWLLLGYALQDKLHGDSCPASKSAVLVLVRDALLSAKGHDQLSDDEIADLTIKIDNVLGEHTCGCDYQERVKVEKEELDTRCESLTTFLSSETFAALPDAEQQRQQSQLKLMKSLSHVLAVRIANFQEEA